MNNLKPISIYKRISYLFIFGISAIFFLVILQNTNLVYIFITSLVFILFIFFYIILTRKKRLLFHFDSVGIIYTNYNKFEYWIKFSEIKHIYILKRGQKKDFLNSYYDFISLSITLHSNVKKKLFIEDTKISVSKFEKIFDKFYSDYSTEIEEIDELIENRHIFIPNRFKNVLSPKLSFIENCEMYIYLSYLILIPTASILESFIKGQFIFTFILSFLIWGSLIFAAFLRMRIKNLLTFYDLQIEYEVYLIECYHFLRYEGHNKYVFNIILSIIPFISFYIQHESYK